MSTSIHPLEQLRRQREAAGTLLSAINSNFRAAGITWPEKLYEEAFRAWRNAPTYHPNGRGEYDARAAIAGELCDEGLLTTPEDLLLTAGSSFSYQIILNHLRDAARQRGETRTRVVLPLPGYPLFDGILSTLDLSPVWYHCRPEQGFQPSPTEIARIVNTPNPPLAIVVITPNNPAGIEYERARTTRMITACDKAGVAVIIDEVFSLFRAEGKPELHAVAEVPTTLPIAHIGGVSKLCAAPGVKAGWIAVNGGNSKIRARYVEALDTYHDTYLTLSRYAECAIAPFITSISAREARTEIRRQVNAMRERFVATITEIEGWRPFPVTSGIHVPIQIDPVYAAERFGTLDDEQIAISILRKSGVLVHPGCFYGLGEPAFRGGPWVVATCLSSTSVCKSVGKALSTM